ncbi:beta-ketoacyl reductase, partial [Desulfobacterales bacterium HSG2]|nr:beta-ketoacyl reductase [Desulfobacterales bacterium HSG2]
WLGTEEAQPVSKEDSSLNAAHSPIWGLARVIDLEYPEIRCTCIDMETGNRQPSTVNRQPKTVNRKPSTVNLFEDIRYSDQEKQIAWRKGVRYAARLRQMNLPIPEKPFPINKEGSYLITGGSGALGIRLARWLAEKGAKHLILISRKLSEASETLISEMETIGVRVEARRADITNYEEMSDLFDRDRISNIKGIFHLAGVLDDGILIQQDRTKFERVMAPKLEGAWNLHLLTRKRSLDFFIMYSSAASVLGSSAQGNYAAANAFLDALAHYRRKLGLPGTSINWGPWDEAGMAAELTSSARRRLSDRGLLPIPPEQGMMMLEDIMGSNEPQPSVISVEWSKYFDQFSKDGIPTLLADMAGKRQKKDLIRKSSLMIALQKAVPEKRSKMLSDLVQKAAIRVSGSEQAPKMDVELMDQGFDSLMGVELRNQLSKELNIPLSSTMIFNYPTLNEIVQYLETKISSEDNGQQTTDNGQQITDNRQRTILEDQLEELSEEEMAEALAKKLEI